MLESFLKRLVQPSVDLDFYRFYYTDLVQLSDAELVEHWKKYGSQEERISTYSAWADILAKSVEQLKSELFVLEEAFDVQYYLNSESTADTNNINPLAHFIQFGTENCSNPNGWFDVDYYIKHNKDVRDSNFNPFAHYLMFGKAENRLASPASTYDFAGLDDVSEDCLFSLAPLEVIRRSKYFDFEYYKNNNPDVAAAGVDLAEHYVCNGEREGRKPSADFDPEYYLQLAPDVRSSGMSPLVHFERHGEAEHRPTHAPTCDSKATLGKPILFVGHDAIQAGSEIVLLELIRWFKAHTFRQVKLLLLSGGSLIKQYAQIADCYVLDQGKVDDKESLSTFLREQFEFVYINTVAAGDFISLLSDINYGQRPPIITHIHEMSNVIKNFHAQFSKLHQSSDFWISASPESEKCLKEEYEIPENRITTINAFINPVLDEGTSHAPLRQKMRNEFGIPETAFLVGGCGTAYSRKGIDIFSEAAQQMLCMHAETDDIRFIWFGDGPDLSGLRDQYREISDKLIFAGNRSDANELVAGLDVFFLSSREDPFPLVCLEAGQYGVPSVCFAPATGITEYVLPDAGLAVAEINVELAVSALSDLYQNVDKRALMGAVAKKKFFDNYTADKGCTKIYSTIKSVFDIPPLLSVIVPCYNHEKYIGERIDSVLSQTIKDIEVIVLDDCSTDGSVKVVESYSKHTNIKLHVNTENSGSPFKQWLKGASLATAEYVWIAEGDDTCELNMLSCLLEEMADPLVNLVAARTEIINENGDVIEQALEPYLNRAYPEKFNNSYKKDGVVDVQESFAAMCTLVNASGIVMRKQAVSEGLKAATQFRMCGDWYVYLSALKQGKIAYCHEAINYFRRHSQSVVSGFEGSEGYFNERYEIASYVLANFPIKPNMYKKMKIEIKHEWERFSYRHENKSFNEVFDFSLLEKKYQNVNSKPHIGFYVHGLLFSKGGIERLACELANELVCRGYTVTIFCRRWAGVSLYPLLESVNVTSCFDEDNLDTSVKVLDLEIRKSNIDIFVPMLSEWLFDPVIQAARLSGVPIVASEHNDPEKIVELWWDEESRNKAFSNVDAIHLILPQFTKSLPENLKSKVKIIPNAVSRDYDNLVESAHREKIIISVGRLAEQKRMDRLVDAFALIKSECSDWRVEIYGEGALEKTLQEKIETLGVQEQVFLMGNVDSIQSKYSAASIFVLPSEFEAFGLVVLEAQSCGLPCIAYAHCNGPNQLITDNYDGLLVEATSEKEQVEKLAEAMLKLTQDRNKIQMYGENSKKNVVKFKLSTICDEWERLFADCLSPSSID